jgi:hypothetical protein
MDVSDARKLKVLESGNAKLKKLVAEQLLAIDALKEFSRGNMTSPLARRRLMALTGQRGLFKRSACRILGVSRRVACCRLRPPEKDRATTDQLVSTSQRVPRFGYRRAAARDSRMPCVLDLHTRQCLGTEVARWIR